MTLDILTYPHPVLARQADSIQEITPEVQALARDMVETMYENKGIGLAAPQIGESVKLICVDITGPDLRTDLHILLNPTIIETNGEVQSEEGCLSLPQLTATVQRAEAIKVAAQNLEGESLLLEADGLFAICLQHEIDHLRGVLLTDAISRLKRSLYEKKAKKWQSKTQSPSE